MSSSISLAGRVAVVTGDDVTDRLDLEACTELETGAPLARYKDRLISANVYLDIRPLLEALRYEPDIIVAGRTSDAALFLAPLVHVFSWAQDDWSRLAAGTVVGAVIGAAEGLVLGMMDKGRGTSEVAV